MRKVDIQFFEKRIPIDVTLQVNTSSKSDSVLEPHRLRIAHPLSFEYNFRTVEVDLYGYSEGIDERWVNTLRMESIRVKRGIWHQGPEADIQVSPEKDLNVIFMVQPKKFWGWLTKNETIYVRIYYKGKLVASNERAFKKGKIPADSLPNVVPPTPKVERKNRFSTVNEVEEHIKSLSSWAKPAVECFRCHIPWSNDNIIIGVYVFRSRWPNRISVSTTTYFYRPPDKEYQRDTHGSSSGRRGQLLQCDTTQHYHQLSTRIFIRLKYKPFWKHYSREETIYYTLADFSGDNVVRNDPIAHKIGRMTHDRLGDPVITEHDANMSRGKSALSPGERRGKSGGATKDDARPGGENTAVASGVCPHCGSPGMQSIRAMEMFDRLDGLNISELKQPKKAPGIIRVFFTLLFLIFLIYFLSFIGIVTYGDYVSKRDGVEFVAVESVAFEVTQRAVPYIWIAGGILFIGFSVYNTVYNLSTYKKKMEAWRDNWLCNRCGKAFSTSSIKPSPKTGSPSVGPVPGPPTHAQPEDAQPTLRVHQDDEPEENPKRGYFWPKSGQEPSTPPETSEPRKPSNSDQPKKGRFF